MEKIINHYRQHLARKGKQSTCDDYGNRLSMLERFASMNGITAVTMEYYCFIHPDGFSSIKIGDIDTKAMLMEIACTPPMRGTSSSCFHYIVSS